jgi:hypothetical protein
LGEYDAFGKDEDDQEDREDDHRVSGHPLDVVRFTTSMLVRLSPYKKQFLIQFYI